MTLRSSHILTIILLATLLLTVPFLVEAAATKAGPPTAFQNVLWSITVSVFGLFVWLSSAIIDIGINTYVIGFGDKFITTGVGSAVDSLWTTVRDIFNLTFIFGLVFIGFKMILNSDDSNTKRWLINLILAALLVNFSLFITKAVVDFTNIAATQIAQGFPVDGDKVSLSKGYMNMLGIQSLLGGNVVPGTEQNAYGFIFGTMILFVVMTFVFAAGGILLLIRYVVLCLYMILSPLMFLGWVFPQLQSISNQYWQGFLSRAFFAPVFLLLVYFSLFVLSALYKGFATTATENESLKNAFATAQPGQLPSVEAAFIPFILSAIFLIASIVVANKMGADGASTALRMGKSASSWAQTRAKRAGIGTTKFAASQTGGRLARRGSYALGNTLNQQISRMQNSNNRLVRAAARSTAVDSTVRGGAAKMTNAKFGLARTREQEQAESNRINRNADRRADEERTRQAEQNTRLTPASTDAEITAHQNARQAHAQEVSQMSNEQVVEMARQDRAYVQSPEFASLLSVAQTTALRESGIYDNAEMTQLEQNRTDGALQEVNQVLTNSNASVENLNTAIDNLNRTVSTMSDQQISDVIARDTRAGRPTDPAFAASMTQAQFDTYMNSSASQAEKNALRTARGDGQQRIAHYGSLVDPTSAGATSPGATDADFQDRNRRRLFRNAQQAGALPAAVLADPEVREFLTPRIIEEFLNNNPNPGDITSVRNNVEDYITDPLTPNAVTSTWQTWMNTTVLGRRFQ